MAVRLKSIALAVCACICGTVAANAALLDFTDNATPFATGPFASTQYTVSGLPKSPNRNQSFDGDASLVSAPLALDNDGIGIGDDEITYRTPSTELLTVRFDDTVRLTGVHFLDLFEAPDSATEEVAMVTVDDKPIVLTFGAFQRKMGDNPGYAFASTDVTGRTFRFSVLSTNDAYGDPDYALAALDVAPVPVPAAGLLLVGAIGALGATRRRRT